VAASPSLFSLSPCRARAAVNVDVPHGCHVATCFRLLNWVACSQSRLHRLQQDPIGSPTRPLPCPVLLFFFQFADSRMEEKHKSAQYVALAAAAALGQSLQVSVLLDSPTLERDIGAVQSESSCSQGQGAPLFD
jgi:hypothetical protein